MKTPVSNPNPQSSRLTAELHKQTEEPAKLDQIIWANLKDIGYGE